MGRPNYPCIQLSSPYSKYVERGPEAPINPYDIDYFILPDENAPCPPYNKTIYELNLPTKTLSPSFIKVSDILMPSIGCEPFYIELSGVDRQLFEISGSGLYFQGDIGVDENPAENIPFYPWTWIPSSNTRNYSINVLTKNIAGNVIGTDIFTLSINCS